MFNKKLDERIEALETREKRINQRIWELENPPKFKRGDNVYVMSHNLQFSKVADFRGIVTDCRTKNCDVYGMMRLYEIMSTDNHKIYKIHEDYVLDKESIKTTPNKIKIRLFDCHGNGSYTIVDDNIVCDKVIEVTTDELQRIKKVTKEYEDVMEIFSSRENLGE